MKKIKVASDYTGIGAFDQALIRLGIPYKTVFACDMDKFARQSYIANYGKPDYFPENVYDRKIPKEPLDIYMSTPPCQGFSIAGKREGSILFYNSHEFIRVNKPRCFVLENVKGLLSHDEGRTFNTWISMLGGKTINGTLVLFPHKDSLPYHIYYRVLNAKHYGVPQNRERVFIVGIRDDEDNNFSWPDPFPLEKRIKDILESDVDEKYFLSDKLLKFFNKHSERHREKGNGFKFEVRDLEDIAVTVSTKSGSRPTDNYVRIGAIRGRNPDNPKDRTVGSPTEQMLEINEHEVSNTLTTVQKDNVVVLGSLEGGKWDKMHEQSRRVYSTGGPSPTIHTMVSGNSHPKIYESHKIRRLTPRECMRLMDFPEEYKIVVSNSQSYKQAGNSIVVNVLYSIIKNLNL